ncbi:LpxL/LpxP family acyltransferase [Ideonella sp. BN130291]|uniref:LpxL/LpxP family acyltransferase n=1 Tax=Ideonella sp. BN130291 TaxID=3112940 RepID=UPI002E270CBE|nr:acyl-CoA synthetase [Ideonella sp. BN130291]
MNSAAQAPAAAGANSWARAPERSNAFALRVMTWIALTFGRRVARWVLHPITLYFVLFAPTARRHSRRFLGRALGRPARLVDCYRQVHAFTATILDRVYLLRGRLDQFEVTVRGGELIEQTLAEGRGAFLLGAHVGSFEVLRTAGQAHVGMRVAMVMYPDNARMINAALSAIAPDSKPDIIALGRVESMLAVRDWLDGGGLAGMLADRQLPGESERAGEVRVPFLGHDAPFSDGPFRLAALLRRRLVFMAGVYLGGNRYDVRLEPLADFSGRLSGPEREARIREAIVAYAARLEALCREHPYNWFNFHDFWREDAS